MENEEEVKVLRMQAAGIRLYGDLAELYYWLGQKNMSDILWEKVIYAVEQNTKTRQWFVDEFGEMVSAVMAGDRKPSHAKVATYRNQLQWQEGTEEPEDEPNISNGVDIIPKRTPTRQPWEQPWVIGRSSAAKPEKKEDKEKLYEESLDAWLAYEREALDVYRKMEEKYPFVGLFRDMAEECEAEIGRLQKPDVDKL